MQRGAKIALASGIVLSGLAGASLFRKPPRAAAPADAEPTRLDRPAASLFDQDPSSVARLSDQIDPVAMESPPAITAENAISPPTARRGPDSNFPPAEAPQPVEGVDPSDDARSPAAPRRPLTHRVRDGDTLSSLARDYLGSSKRFLEIYEANQHVLKRPDLLPIGAELKIPSPDQIARAPEAKPAVEPAVERPLAPLSPRPAPRASAPAGVKRTYRVRAGDTLVAIAKQFYGDGERYLEIYEANRQRLKVPDDLREGLLLEIP